MRKALYMMGILEDADVAWLASNGRRRPVRRGEVLIDEGRTAGSLYIVLDGEFAVTTRARGEVARLLAGEIVGEVSFVDSRPPTATVTALRDSLILDISAGLVKTKLGRDALFAAHFYRSLAMFLADRLRSTMSREGHPDTSEDLEMEMMDNAALAAARFDKLLKSA